MTGMLLILAGIALGGWAFPYHYLPRSARPGFLRTPVGRIFHILCSLGVFVLIGWGLVWFLQRASI